jgi:hypothetical protein
VTNAVSIFFPDVSQVLGIVGGLAATSIQFMVPLLLAKILSKKGFFGSGTNILNTFIMGTLSLLGYTNVAITIYKVFVPDDTT